MKADLIKKIAIVGPECTGKSDLSAFLANHFETDWVPEYARGYVNNLIRPYEEHDLLTIAHGQMRLEDEWMIGASRLLFCDTNLLVIKVWSEFKFGTCDPQIIGNLKTRHYDLHLLTYVDLPWENDPLREHPDNREQLYEIYFKELKAMNVPFTEIRGVTEQRRKTAIEAVDRLLNSNG